ncbi:MAG: protein phosphatase 2C domain-containing protein [Burkholderiales bacterium]|jgi:protein phosphatase|nr:protein phosphatase 2C domain-containing protein [Burkholderiales bacterium]
MSIRLEVASRTDAGLVRKVNEDAIGIDAGAGVMVIADGMAKVQGAEVASRVAARTILQKLSNAAGARPLDELRAAFDAASQAIGERVAREPTYEGMGATAVAAWFSGPKLAVGHVGDARLYRLRKGELRRMTVDHSFVQTQLAQGRVTEEETRQSRSRHLVTRALGASGRTTPDVAEHPVEPGDLYLLCTDGLHELVEEADLAGALTALEPNLELASETLVTLANDRGGADNVSVILVKIGEPEAEVPVSVEKGLLARLRAFFGGGSH